MKLSEIEQIELAEELLRVMKQYADKLNGTYLGQAVNLAINMVDYGLVNQKKS